MLPIRDSLQLYGHTWAQSEGMRKDIASSGTESEQGQLYLHRTNRL